MTVCCGRIVQADMAVLREVGELMIVAWGRQPMREEVERRAVQLEADLGHLDPAAGAMFVARLSDKIIGFGRVMSEPEDASQWLLFALVVHPEHRRQGVARALVQAGIDYARQRGAKRIGSQVHTDNAASIGFHEALGFARSDIIIAPDGDRLMRFRMNILETNS